MDDIHHFKRIRFAYVTMVLSYSEIHGALVLAHSLKKQKVINHVILLIYEEIDNDILTKLEKRFDKVIRISLVIPSDRILPKKTFHEYQYIHKIKHYKEIEPAVTRRIEFSKIIIYNLTDYEKVLYITPYALAIQKYDSLFELNTPAVLFPSKGLKHGKKIFSVSKIDMSLLLIEPNS